MEKFMPASKFHSKDEEIKYWSELAQRLHEKKEEMKTELEEYQESSVILEKELEMSYEQSMGKNRELQLTNNKLVHENAELKVRLHEQVDACAELQAKMHEMRHVIDEMSIHVRKLEQENDDLERANRELKVSEEAMEDQFNDVIEKLALLETEIEEKEGLQIIIQRLKDENKDLKHQHEVDLRKSQGSPLTRIRKMSIVRRHRRQNSTESEKSLSVHEETSEDFHCKNDKNNLLEYISELEKEIKILKKNQRTSKVVIVDVATEKNITIETDFFRERPNLDKDEERSIPGYVLQSIENKESQKAQVRLRSPRGGSVERAPRPLSVQNKVQDENARALAASRTNRILENRVKKVKDEEKHQNLMHFLKRFRYRQPSWMRKKH